MVIRRAAEAIDWYEKAFDAGEVVRENLPNGSIRYAELRIGASVIMLGAPCDDIALLGIGDCTSSIVLRLYVSDLDRQFSQAIAAGGEVLSEVKEQLCGDRAGILKDPFDYIWFLHGRKGNVSSEYSRLSGLFGSDLYAVFAGCCLSFLNSCCFAHVFWRA